MSLESDVVANGSSDTREPLTTVSIAPEFPTLLVHRVYLLTTKARGTVASRHHGNTLLTTCHFPFFFTQVSM